MRHLVLILAAGLAAAADTVPADPVFDCRPGRISITRQRYWQNDGRRTNDNRDFEVSVRFHTKNDAMVLGWKDLVVSEAVSDAGEALEYNRNGSQHEGRVDIDRQRLGEREQAAFEVGIDFAWPQKPSNGIASLTGSVTVLVATGAPKRAVLKPFKDIVGKVMEIADVAGGEITVDQAEQREGVTLRYKSQFQDKIVGVSFLDGSGREIRSGGWGGGSNGNEVERTYHVRLPEDGAVVVSIAPESRSISVPFQLSGVSVEAGPGGKTARERIKVQATDEPAVAPVEGNVPVKVLEPAAGF